MDEKEKEAIAWQWLYSNTAGRQRLEKEHEWLRQYLDENLGSNWKARSDADGWRRPLN